MDTKRISELAGLSTLIESSGQSMKVADFEKKSATEQVKLLWQWSTSKQMPLADWKTFLEAYCKGKS